MKVKNAVILHQEIIENAAQDELDVLVQAGEIKKVLEKKNFKVAIIPADKNFKFIDKIKKIKVPVVFNLVETFNGSGKYAHIVPLILEQLKIPYTGNSSDAVYLTGNKVIAKEIMSSYEIPTPEWYSKILRKKLNYGVYIFKPIAEDASVGINDESLIMIDSNEKIENNISVFEKKYKTSFFCEKFIEGREFNISVLEVDGKPLVLSPAEMIFKKENMKFKIVDYESKWDEESEKYKNSVRSFSREPKDNVLIDKLSKISKECWKLFSLSGYARIDFRVDKENNPYVLEINANPCLSPDGGFYAASLMDKFNFDEIVMKIVDGAFNENKKRHFTN